MEGKKSKLGNSFECLHGNVSTKVNPNSISLFGSINMFDVDGFGDTARDKKNPMLDIKNYGIGQDYQNNIDEFYNIPKNTSLHQSIQIPMDDVKNEKQNNEILLSSGSHLNWKNDNWKEKKNTKSSKPIFSYKTKGDVKQKKGNLLTKFSFVFFNKKKPNPKENSMNQSAFNPYCSISSEMYESNNYNAKKGTDQTKKINFHKGK